jgi:hypothetical protein
MPAERAPPDFDAVLRTTVALVGTLPCAVLSGICIARWLPIAEDVRFALGFTIVIPLWIAAICIAALAKSGVRALLVCAALTIGLGLLARHFTWTGAG